MLWSIALRTVLLAAAIASPTMAAAGSVSSPPCADVYDLAFGVKPPGQQFWLSAPRAFRATLPATLVATAGETEIEAYIERISPEMIVVRYRIASPVTQEHLSLISVQLRHDDPKPFKGQVTDGDAYTWWLAARPLCAT